MSTVIEDKDDPGAPLSGTDELVAYIASGEKTRDQFKIGTEHEKFGFLREDKSPLPYDGPRGIKAIFEEIVRDDPSWRAVSEGGNPIALFKNNASITLEPGGQLELSGAPLENLFETCQEVGEHLELLKRICIPKGVGFIGIGYHPTATWDEMASVPKLRYAIMQRYMPQVGSRGLDMMKRTATVQANFDFENERDMVESFRTALAISPVVTALFANSVFAEGRLTGWISERARVWSDTDPDRSGFPACVFEKDFGYERWVDYVLDVPMYFVRRDGDYLDASGQSFREFMGPGVLGHKATLRDFTDHLSTVFPEVRLKKYLEVRGQDCGPWSRICALPAMWKGVLYDVTARDGAWALMDEATPEELRELQLDVARRGLDAEYRGKTVHELGTELVEISRAGLERLRVAHNHSDESHFLRPVVEVVEKKRTFGEWLRELYESEWSGDVSRIYDEIEFWEDRRKEPRED